MATIFRVKVSYVEGTIGTHKFIVTLILNMIQ